MDLGGRQTLLLIVAAPIRLPPLDMLELLIFELLL
jgi:hypothetical protein